MLFNTSTPLLLLLLLVPLAFVHFISAADDPLAQAKCRSVHATDVDASGTVWANNQCTLICSIHGQLWPHNMSEGLVCPGLTGTTNVCSGGQCVSPVKLGFIDIEMASADLGTAASAYADVCIQNSSTTVTLPIANRTTCVSCQTKVIASSLHPVWSSVCTGSDKFLWTDQSRVTFEVWDQISTTKNNFVGGASLLIPQLLANGDNHKSIALPLASGANSGKINVRVTWTPK